MSHKIDDTNYFALQEKRACIKCLFWERDDNSDDNFGWCRRYPPQGHVIQLPYTHVAFWCGEYKPRNDDT